VSYWDLGTVILDVRNPARPRFLGRTKFRAHEEGNAHSAWLAHGGRVLIQNDEDFDPSPDPNGVVETAWGYPRYFTTTIVWGVFPSRGLVLASDINSGLWVLRLRR
jgi:hypothetical protein